MCYTDTLDDDDDDEEEEERGQISRLVCDFKKCVLSMQLSKGNLTKF